MRSAPSSRRRATAAGTTPAATPGRPAWTTPSTGAPAGSSPTSTTGTQSATRTASGSVRETMASAVGAAGPSPAESAAVDPTMVATSLPWTWFMYRKERPPSPAAASSSARRRRTATGSSPTCSARFPAPASVKATHTPGRTSARQQNNHNTAINMSGIPAFIQSTVTRRKAAWHRRTAVPCRSGTIYFRKSGTSRSSECRPDRSGSTTAGRSTSKPESAGTAEGRCWPQPP